LLSINTATAQTASAALAAAEARETWSSAGNTRTDAAAQAPQAARSVNEIIERVFKRENEEVEIIESYAPIVETYIQLEKSDALMGTVPKSDLYFLGIADFRGKTMKIQPMTEK